MIREKNGYNYIWSTLQLAKKMNIQEYDIKFRLLENNMSAYMEVNNNNLNKNEINNEKLVDVNGYYRFNDIFDNEEIIEENTAESIKIFKDKISNIILHFLAHIDLLRGLNARTITINRIVEELKTDIFGKEIQEGFLILNKEEQKKVAILVQDMFEYDNSIKLFQKAVKKIFNDSLIYNNRYNEKTIVIYINEEKTKENKKKIKLLTNLFLSIGFQIKIYWQFHPMVFGVKEIMKIELGAIS